MLADLEPDAVLAAAVKHVRDSASAFPPSIAELRALVLKPPRIVKVPEYARDTYGSRLLDRSGALKIARWHDVRVPFDWDGDAGSLEYGELPSAIEALQPKALPSGREERQEQRRRRIAGGH